MKRLFTIALLAAMAIAVVAQPQASWLERHHDFGVIKEADGKVSCQLRLTNTGNEPLLIQKPKSSCGCTIPSWPNEPILPGESDVIKVTYKTNRVGNINKTVTVTSNALKNSTVVLRIKGRVLEQANEALPEKKERFQ